MAADHQRLNVIDQLLAAGTPVDDSDTIWNRHPLRLAAENGRPLSVQRLLDHGADPNRADSAGRTPLDLARAARLTYPTHPSLTAVEAILEPLTVPSDGAR